MKWKKFRIKTKNRPLPEEHVCRNCGAETVGKYCHECGQNVFAGTEQPIMHLLGQMLTNAFSLDAKTPRTLAFLMFRPGFLSIEYRAGRISRYVHPVKLFWMSTLIFFALIIFQLNNNKESDKEIVNVQQNGVNITIGSPSNTTNLPSTNKEQDPEKMKRDEKLYDIFINSLSKYAPYLSFLFIPVFALLITLFFWRKKYYYIHHLSFTVHFHTFLWIFLSLLLIIGEFPDWLAFLLFLLPGIYFSIALHRYYKTKTRWQAVWKAILILSLYFILIIAVIVLLVIWMLKASQLYPELL
jgi:hypothetical protein